MVATSGSVHSFMFLGRSCSCLDWEGGCEVTRTELTSNTVPS